MPEILVVLGLDSDQFIVDDAPLSHLFEVVVEALPKLRVLL